MSDLTDAYQAQYSVKYAVAQTNPDKASATTVDTVRLDSAGTSTEADFRIFAGVLFDATDARHLVIGVEGVAAYLQIRSNHKNPTRDRDEFRDRLRDLAQVTSRSRLLPTLTKDNTVHLPEPEKPDFHDDLWGNHEPERPFGGPGKRITDGC